MAISKCRECGEDVSDSAKTCPKCGVSKPVKKTSLGVKILAILLGLGVLGQLISGAGGKSTTTNSSSSVQARPSEDELASKVTIKDFRWGTGGFGSVLVLSKIVIENKNAEPVKDFEIECIHRGPSGTVIDRNTKTLFEIVPANKSITLHDINMGFINSQAATSSCGINSVKRMS